MSEKDLLVSSTGNFNICSVVHMMLRNRVSVDDIGHFDNEFDLAGLGASGEFHHPPQRVWCLRMSRTQPAHLELSDIDQKVAPPLSVGSVGSSARLFVAEGDPRCALQVRTEGVQTSRLKTTSCFFNELFNIIAAQR